MFITIVSTGCPPVRSLISAHDEEGAGLSLDDRADAVDHTRDAVAADAAVLDVAAFEQQAPPPLFGNAVAEEDDRPLLQSLFVVGRTAGIVVGVMEFLRRSAGRREKGGQKQYDDAFHNQSFLITPSIPVLTYDH